MRTPPPGPTGSTSRWAGRRATARSPGTATSRLPTDPPSTRSEGGAQSGSQPHETGPVVPQHLAHPVVPEPETVQRLDLVRVRVRDLGEVRAQDDLVAQGGKAGQVVVRHRGEAVGEVCANH